MYSLFNNSGFNSREVDAVVWDLVKDASSCAKVREFSGISYRLRRIEMTFFEYYRIACALLLHNFLILSIMQCNLSHSAFP